MIEACDQTKQCGFAATGRAEQGNEVTRFQAQGHVAQSLDTTGEPPAKVRYCQHGQSEIVLPLITAMNIARLGIGKTPHANGGMTGRDN